MRITKFLFAIMVLTLSILLLSCSSEEKVTDKTVIKKENPEIPLPPGQADVIALITEYSEDENNIFADLKIDEVFGYGPSTPPLPVGSGIKLIIPKRLIETEQIKKGGTKSMRISFAQGVGDTKQWTFVMFSQKKNEK